MRRSIRMGRRLFALVRLAALRNLLAARHLHTALPCNSRKKPAVRPTCQNRPPGQPNRLYDSPVGHHSPLLRLLYRKRRYGPTVSGGKRRRNTRGAKEGLGRLLVDRYFFRLDLNPDKRDTSPAEGLLLPGDVLLVVNTLDAFVNRSEGRFDSSKFNLEVGRLVARAPAIPVAPPRSAKKALSSAKGPSCGRCARPNGHACC
jgi:hypothetical protein